MNLNQKVLVGAAPLIAAIMFAFPPWYFDYNYSSHDRNGGQTMHTQRPAGYHTLWDSHVPSDPSALAQLFAVPLTQASPHYFTVRLDTQRLFTQFAGLSIATILLYLLLRSRGKMTP